MNEDLDFPDAVAAIVALIDGHTFAGHTVTAGTYLDIDGYGHLVTTPCARVTTTGIKTGYIDEVTTATVELFAAADHAATIAQAIRTDLCGTDIETPEGTLDSLQAPNKPVTNPFQDRTDRALFTMQAVARPLT